MALENITDQIKEKFTELKSKIQESPAFNSLKERFETQSPAAQRAIVAGASVLAVLLLFSFPYSDLSTSSQNLKDFETHRSLLRQLLRASRLANDTSGGAVTLSANEVRNQVQSQLGVFNLQPEQLVGIVDLDAKALAGSLAKNTPGVQLTGIGVSLKSLNLKQVVDIGFEMQKLSPSVKMAGMEVTAGSPDPHYFDVQYKLVAFGMPDSTGDSAATAPKRGRQPPAAIDNESALEPDGDSN
jgi:hypothetical protein